MQKRESARTKGPESIAGAITKTTAQAILDDDEAPVGAAWYLYAAADIDIGAKRIPLRAWTWKKFTDRGQIQKICENARRQGIHYICTQTPPKDVI